uniref:beta-1,3-glucan-binding protein-like n=1 Tax=Styela clava TaxID=7725 RepID=UPI0019398378|nr:beta-1,3-glucan-binding protein-like [Styela clava]
MKALLVILGLIYACSAYVVQQPTITLLEPQGIQFSYPADQGTTLVAYHFSINSDVIGVAAGQYNVDVNSPTNGAFVYRDTSIVVGEGDTVSYWVNVINNGAGYLLTDQSYTFTAPTMPTTTQPQPVTTQQPTQGAGDNEVTNAPQTTTKPTSGGSGSGGGNGGTVSTTCSVYPCDASCDMGVPPCNGLIFEENWDTFDLSRWQHEITMSGGGNWEFQVYSNNRTNSYVRDNTLFIKPTLTADHYGESFLSSGTLDLWGSSPADFCTANSFWGCQRTGSGSNYINPAQSARIRSVHSFSVKYGRIEVVAKMPKGDWLWPAIWMLPRDNAYGGWPASGEIDIVEARGNTNLKDESGVSKGYDNMGMTLHWGPYWPMNAYTLTTVERVNASNPYGTDFHKWVVDWTDEYIDFYVDDDLLRRVDPGSSGFWNYGDFGTSAPGSDNPWENGNKMTPFDQEFYLLLNVAVGGTNGFFPDSWTNSPSPKPWLNNSPTAMRDFWQAKNQWYPTWQADVNNGENAAMQVKSIKVWAN